MADPLGDAEEQLLDHLSGEEQAEPTPVLFVLAAPRAGSTVAYQMMVNAFDVYYFSNLVNDLFGSWPAVGALIDLQLNPRHPVPYRSSYGKTEGWFGPSEASAVWRHWFGGEHPSELRSSEVLPGRVEHLQRSLASIAAAAGRAIVAKNAWNCFRIEELVRLLPGSAFVWVRRDIVAAAQSDLEARYRRGGPTVWNSATPADYRQIQQRPYWEQVVEQQHSFNVTIGRDLARCAPGRWVELWYEDVCSAPEDALGAVAELGAALGIRLPRTGAAVAPQPRSPGPDGMAEDRARVAAYVAAEGGRLAGHRHPQGEAPA